MTAFWDTTPCIFVQVGGRFGCAYCLHHRHSTPW